MKVGDLVAGLACWCILRGHTSGLELPKQWNGDPRKTESISETDENQSPNYPTAPRDLTIPIISSTQFMIRWKEPLNWNGAGDGYLMWNEDTKFSVVIPKTQTSYFAIGLTPWTKYSYLLSGFNMDNGKRNLGDAITVDVETLMTAPSEPLDLKVTSYKSTSLEVSWSQPVAKNGPLSGYTVTDGHGKYEMLSPDRTSYVLEGLTPWTNYSISVSAYNTQGSETLEGPKAQVVQKTEVDAPSACVDFSVVSVTFESVSLHWSPPSTPNGPLDGYNLHHTGDGIGISLVTRSTFVTVTNLESNTNYNFTVTPYNVNLARNKNIDGPKSSLVVTTLVPAPGKVANLATGKITKDSVIVSWDKPLGSKVPIHGYDVTYFPEGQPGNSTTVSVKDTYAKIENLKSWTKYHITVSAFNVMNGDTKVNGPEDDVTATTLISAPGRVSQLSTRMVSSYDIEIHWHRPIEPNGPISGYVISHINDGRLIKSTITDTSFVISNLTPWTEYKISVFAFNIYEGVRLNGTADTLDVQTSYSEPSPPVSLTIKSITRSTVRMSWLPPTRPNGPIAGYKVYLNNDTNNLLMTNTKEKEYLFEDLDFWTEYICKVGAFNIDVTERLGPAASIIVRTDPIEPSAARSLSATNIQNSSITVTWLSPEHKNGPIDGYLVKWRTKTQNVGESTTNETLLDVTGLSPWTEYVISVAAFNVEQMRQKRLTGPGVEVVVSTSVWDPSEPVSLSVDSITVNSFTVSWKKPLRGNGPVDGYLLSLGSHNVQYEVTTNDTIYTFKELLPWTDYKVSVSAFNSKGAHERYTGPSASVSVRTETSEPSAPVSLSVDHITDTSFSVSWERPQNGSIDGYFVTLGSPRGLLPLQFTIDSQLTFEDLQPWTDYNVTVSAYNSKGPRERNTGPAASIDVKTKPSVPPDPLQISALQVKHTSASIRVPTNLFSEKNGPIVAYALLVAAGRVDPLPRRGRTLYNDTKFLNWKEAAGTKKWYKASPDDWTFLTDNDICKSGNSSFRECWVGVQSSCNEKNFCNAPLQPKTQYSVKIQGYTAAGWAESLPLKFSTGGSAINIIHRFIVVLAIVCYGCT